jgi:hypothetical protein
VEVTFPISWLTSPPQVPNGEKPFKFYIDMKHFNLVYGNHNPTEITVIFHHSDFEGHQLAPQVAFPGVPTPQIYFDPPAINFYTKPGVSPEPENMLISVKDAPLGWTFNWSLSCNVSWLEVSPETGEAFRFGETVWLRPDVTGISEGTYTAILTLTGDKLDNPRTFTVKLFITDTELDQTPDIKIEPAIGSCLTPGIILEKASVSVTTLDKPFSSLEGSYFNTGDRCILITGTLRNDTGQEWQVAYHAEGYDIDGNRVSSTLDAGPRLGLLAFDIPAKSSRDFTLHLNWVENVTPIRITANTYDPTTPLP